MIISRQYYKQRLIKVTTSVTHLAAGSIYKNRNNRYVKIYERRNAIGEPWKVMNHSAVNNYAV